MYDALYVAVAEAEGVPLITADAGLIAAVSASDNRIIHMDAVSL